MTSGAVASAKPDKEAAPNHEAAPKADEAGGRVVLGDEKPTKPTVPRATDGWVELASSTPAKHGTEFIVVGEKLGAFSALRIDAAKGKTILRKVKVFFVDGKTKTVQVDRIISERGVKSARVELGDARVIDRVVINTETEMSGEYAVYGSTSAAGVASR